MNSEYQEIIRAGDDTVDGEVLAWAGMWDFWQANEEVLGKYSVINDVLERCSLVDIDREVWDGGAPGQSGVTFVISTTAPKDLREEIRSILEGLAEPYEPRIAESSESETPKKIDTVEALIEFLRREAYRYSKMRGPAGCGDMPRGIANRLSAAADDLAINHGSREDVIACLTRFLSRGPGSAVNDQIRAIIESYPPTFPR